ncbi:EF-hand domain-containing protein [Entamoeba marina]
MNHLFNPPTDVDLLFKMADCDGDGIIGRDDALQFFPYTYLPNNILSLIWSHSVPPKKPMNSLHFIIALRLIGCAQKGLKIDKKVLESSAPPYSAPSIDCPFIIETNEFKSLEKVFDSLVDTSCDTIPKNVFAQYYIKTCSCVVGIQDVLQLCKINTDNDLNRIEFITAMTVLKSFTKFHSLPKRIPVHFTKMLVCIYLITPITDIQLSRYDKEHIFLPAPDKQNQKSKRFSHKPLKQTKSELFSFQKQIEVTQPLQQPKPIKLDTLSSNQTTSLQTKAKKRSNHLSIMPLSISQIPRTVTEKLQSPKFNKSLHERKLSHEPTVNVSVVQNLSPRSRVEGSNSPRVINFLSKKKSGNSPPLHPNDPNHHQSASRYDVGFNSHCTSPFLSTEELSPFQRSRRQSIQNLTEEIEFGTFSFSEDVTLSSEDNPPEYRMNFDK